MEKKIEPYKGIAEIYDEIRPSYPEELIQDVISKTNLDLKNALLDIGAGTGKATIQFAEKGFSVHAIEIGEDMAEILKEKCVDYPNVSVNVVSFEEWNCPKNLLFDMIYSAQSFHWLDLNVKYKKCHELLKNEGHLVLFWYSPCIDKFSKTIEIEEEIEKIVEKYTFNYSSNTGKPERRAHDGVSNEDLRKAEIEASGLFKLIEKVEYIQEIRNTAKQYLKVMKSVPAFASKLDSLEDRVIYNMDKEIEGIINNYGGYVSVLFTFSLYITKKI